MNTTGELISLLSTLSVSCWTSSREGGNTNFLVFWSDWMRKG